MKISIHNAARAGDFETIRQKLDAGMRVDAVEVSSGFTPLMAACSSPDAGVHVVALLMELGADVNAFSKAPHGEYGEPVQSVVLAVRHAPMDVIESLLAAKVNLHYRSKHGYTLMTYAAIGNRIDVVLRLCELGALLDGASKWGESALSALSYDGRFEEIGKLLKAGADPAPLRWTRLHRAVALGTLYAVKANSVGGLDLEARDGWERTPFLLAVQVGSIAKASHVLDCGASTHATGRGGKPATMYPLHDDNDEMLKWLIEQGFDVDASDAFGTTALLEAAERGAVACFRALLNAGADAARTDHANSTLIGNASHPEVISILLARGENPAELEAEVLRDYIGLGTIDRLDVAESDYRAGRERKFGNRNPQPTDNPFWIEMVRCGWSAYGADDSFGERSCDTSPTWCHDRFGMSLTPLPDGRFVQIAGEHEDYYDPDFCIYNDVVVHDGKGGFQIYGYPREIFPPTDFHSATLIGKWIYIIGNLGYIDERGTQTPVYRLSTTNFTIQRVETSGDDPGWISRHRAALDGDRVVVMGGKRFLQAGSSRGSDYVDRDETHVFDVAKARWCR